MRIVLTRNIIVEPGYNSAHATTVQLPLYVQNHGKFSRESKFKQNDYCICLHIESNSFL